MLMVIEYAKMKTHIQGFKMLLVRQVPSKWLGRIGRVRLFV